MRWSDFGIRQRARFGGRKIGIESIFGKEIIIHDYVIEDSKFKKPDNPKRLRVQAEVDGEICIFFTGSNKLIEAIQEGEDLIVMPFITTIINCEKDGYKFN